MVERIDEDEWEGRKEVIRRMYVEEDRKLSAIMKVLAAPPSFNPTVSQYKTRLRHWGFKKDRAGADGMTNSEKAKERKHAPPIRHNGHGEIAGSCSQQPTLDSYKDTDSSTTTNYSVGNEIAGNSTIDAAASFSNLQTDTDISSVYDPMLPQPSPSPQQIPSDHLTIIPTSSLLLYPSSTASHSLSAAASIMSTSTNATTSTITAPATATTLSPSGLTSPSTIAATTTPTTNPIDAINTTQQHPASPSAPPPPNPCPAITIIPDQTIDPDVDSSPTRLEAEAKAEAEVHECVIKRMKATYKSRYDVPHPSANKARVHKPVCIHRARKNMPNPHPGVHAMGN